MKAKRTLEDVLNDETLTDKEKYKWYTTKSNEWKEIKSIVLERDNYTCRCCGRTKDDENAHLSVHHREYTHLFHESDNNYEDLITLCKICHLWIHKAPSNKRRFTLKNKL